VGTVEFRPLEVHIVKGGVYFVEPDTKQVSHKVFVWDEEAFVWPFDDSVLNHFNHVTPDSAVIPWFTLA
jgi:hypothetical protein